MADIKVGDRVRVVSEFEDERGRHAGKLGVVDRVDSDDRYLPYRVALDGEGSDWVFSVERTSTPTSRDACATRAKELLTDTDHTIACRHEAQDTLRAFIDGDDIGFHGSSGSKLEMSVYQRPAEARKFARGILALCDEVDGEEAQDVAAPPTPRDIRVGDRVEVLDDDCDGRRFGGCVGTVKTVHPRGDRLPYLVEFGDGKGGHGAPNGQWNCRAVELVDEAPTEESARAITRADFLRQARDLLDGQTYTADDLIHLADDLQGTYR
ncbi:KOW motif-containing protein [Streptomyces zaomyceticus]|uniref:KOW motif-containing protein n=1 Tax=Streptomyces zaomyceticus TaxID=68286 RepID=UPI00343CBAD4